jgi:hypothetical protein
MKRRSIPWPLLAPAGLADEHAVGVQEATGELDRPVEDPEGPVSEVSHHVERQALLDTVEFDDVDATVSRP